MFEESSSKRYIKLFSRSDLWKNELKYPSINIPLSIITDLDVKSWSYYDYEGINKPIYSIINDDERAGFSNFAKKILRI